MKRNAAMGVGLAFALFVSFAEAADAPALHAIKSQAELDKAIASLDAALFDSYNNCDLAKFSSFFADDVEFYHDQGGITLGKDKLTDSIKKNICGTDVRRELVPGTLEAHLMKGYGAVQIAFTVSTIPNPRRLRVRPDSFTSGVTRTAPGRSRVPSASIITS